jgi:hypothetical protein
LPARLWAAARKSVTLEELESVGAATQQVFE